MGPQSVLQSAVGLKTFKIGCAGMSVRRKERVRLKNAVVFLCFSDGGRWSLISILPHKNGGSMNAI
jgi:hypothetical protein